MQISCNTATVQLATRRHCSTFTSIVSCIAFFFSLFRISIRIACAACRQCRHSSSLNANCRWMSQQQLLLLSCTVALLHCAIGSQLRALSFVTASIAMGALDAPSFRYNNCNNNSNEQQIHRLLYVHQLHSPSPVQLLPVPLPPQSPQCATQCGGKTRQLRLQLPVNRNAFFKSNVV